MSNGSKREQVIVLVGGGTMGADIAAGFAAHGWRPHIVNPPDAMARTMDARLRSAMENLGARYDATRFRRHESLADVPWPEADLVIEAAPERLDVKAPIFRELVRLSTPTTPLCSNSSAIPISAIGEGLPTQERMLGTHYFMPAYLVPAVEVVRSVHTDPAVADKVADFLASVGKVPVRVNRDIPGFLANRTQHALSREAISLVERGIATPEDVDNAVRFGFGFRYIAAGPLLQRDHAGLDVHNAAAATIYPHLCNDPAPSPYLADHVKAGHLGIKTGQGFYEWNDETIAAEKARYEAALIGAKAIIDRERDGGVR